MKTFKNYYVIQHPSGTIIPESINCQKNLCIKSWFDGSITWDEFISDQPNYKKEQCYNDVYIVYAIECCKASLEKASENATYNYDQKYDKISINKESITNQDNIVIL